MDRTSKVFNACAKVRCANGYRCEIYKPTGEAFCNPDCRLNNGGCRADQTCKLKEVQCIRAPCPPVVKCIDKGESVHQLRFYDNLSLLIILVLLDQSYLPAGSRLASNQP